MAAQRNRYRYVRLVDAVGEFSAEGYRLETDDISKQYLFVLNNDNVIWGESYTPSEIYQYEDMLMTIEEGNWWQGIETPNIALDYDFDRNYTGTMGDYVLDMYDTCVTAGDLWVEFDFQNVMIELWED